MRQSKKFKLDYDGMNAVTELHFKRIFEGLLVPLRTVQRGAAGGLQWHCPDPNKRTQELIARVRVLMRPDLALLG